MTVIIHIGRRVPQRWFSRQAQQIAGFISFQENIWRMIEQSMHLAKKKANAAGTLKFVLTKEKETEDLHYYLEWIKIIIQGTKEQELEEYTEAMQMYQPFNRIFKKEMPKNDNMSKYFKSKVLSGMKVKEAYDKGFGSVKDNNISNKLLEMGIITHIELVEDYSSREAMPVM